MLIQVCPESTFRGLVGANQAINNYWAWWHCLLWWEQKEILNFSASPLYQPPAEYKTSLQSTRLINEICNSSWEMWTNNTFAPCLHPEKEKEQKWCKSEIIFYLNNCVFLCSEGGLWWELAYYLHAIYIYIPPATQSSNSTSKIFILILSSVIWACFG